jgi:DNA-binding MarR family transcriptional regulator
MDHPPAPHPTDGSERADAVRMRPLTPLAHELGKRNPFPSAAEECFVAIVRTASMLKGQANRLLRSHRLTEPSYNILRILRGAGEGGRCGHEISAQVISEVPDMTRLVDRLEKIGLCERRRVDGDKRLVRVFITAMGLDLLAQLDRSIHDLHRAQFAGIPDDELEELLQRLERVRSAARASSPPLVPTDRG